MAIMIPFIPNDMEFNMNLSPMSSATKVSLILSTIASMISLGGCSSIAIRTMIEIDAPKADVYAILADLDAYPQWNPYHRRVSGAFEEGAKLNVEITRPDGKHVRIPPHIIRIEENQEISWGGGIKGVFFGEHRFLLRTTQDGQTVLEHNEDFSGIAIGFADLPADVITKGYQQMNLALKHRAEARTKVQIKTPYK